MAIDSAPKHTRRSIAGVRRLDYMEASLCDNAKSISSDNRIRFRRTIGTFSSNYDIVRAYIVLLVCSTSGGAAITTVIERWH